MAKQIPITKRTDKDIMIQYGFGYADLMDIFDVSKQMAFNYLSGESNPSVERLRDVAIEKAGELEAQMCAEILANRGLKVIELKEMAA